MSKPAPGTGADFVCFFAINVARTERRYLFLLVLVFFEPLVCWKRGAFVNYPLTPDFYSGKTTGYNHSPDIPYVFPGLLGVFCD